MPSRQESSSLFPDCKLFKAALFALHHCYLCGPFYLTCSTDTLCVLKEFPAVTNRWVHYFKDKKDNIRIHASVTKMLNHYFCVSVSYWDVFKLIKYVFSYGLDHQKLAISWRAYFIVVLLFKLFCFLKACTDIVLFRFINYFCWFTRIFQNIIPNPIHSIIWGVILIF